VPSFRGVHYNPQPPDLMGEVEILTRAKAGDKEESVTWIVKEKVPSCIGIPEIRPVEASKPRSGGRGPSISDHVYGGFPPDASSCRLYGWPIPPSGRLVVVIINTGCSIEALTIAIAVCCCTSVESATRAVNVHFPGCVGVPVMAPLSAFNDNPGGSWPKGIDHV
jgi:hypothetical protein